MAKNTKNSKIAKKAAKKTKMLNEQVDNSTIYFERRPNFINELLPRSSRW